MSRKKEVTAVKVPEIKVKVTFMPGYEKRFTAACLEVIKRREKQEQKAG